MDLDLTYTFNDATGHRNIAQREPAGRALHYLKLHGRINWWGVAPGFRASREGALAPILWDSPLGSSGIHVSNISEVPQIIDPVTAYN